MNGRAKKWEQQRIENIKIQGYSRKYDTIFIFKVIKNITIKKRPTIRGTQYVRFKGPTVKKKKKKDRPYVELCVWWWDMVMSTMTEEALGMVVLEWLQAIWTPEKQRGEERDFLEMCTKMNLHLYLCVRAVHWSLL